MPYAREVHLHDSTYVMFAKKATVLEVSMAVTLWRKSLEKILPNFQYDNKNKAGLYKESIIRMALSSQ